ncbi:MAG TPA: SDR family oxidoreductase [Chloroflexi bacterium]|nr:SDR family oxidoreductase [Chloroflexota bacterium]
MNLNLDGKKALITGASRGIGRVIAQKFAAAGAKVAVHYNSNRAAAEETLNSLPDTGHIIVQANMSSADEVEQMVAAAVETLAGLDILVNNAGVFEAHPLDTVDYATWQAKWQKIIQTNLLGAANASYCAARFMIEQGGGRIINVGSRGAYRGEPESPAYGASKAGMHAMSQSLAKHLGPHNIYVTAVAPGFVQTEMARESLRGASGDEIRAQSPLHRVAAAEEVAHTVLFLAAPGSEWLTGGVIDVNGASYLR